MKRRVYIESDGKYPIDDWGAMALYGFLKKGYDVRLFQNLFVGIPCNSDNIVVACIEATELYLDRFGINLQPLNIPDELMGYTGRQVIRTTMGDFKNQSVVPVFIKPVTKVNGFSSGVIKQQSSRSTLFNQVDDNLPVIVSEYVDFVSEYRGYVYDKKLQGLNWYNGEMNVFPDVGVIEQAIADYKSQPAGYSIDFGVTSDNRTLLVECNDGWALGNYGFEPLKYATLLERRWFEIMRSKK
jgi:hypothetical protein